MALLKSNLLQKNLSNFIIFKSKVTLGAVNNLFFARLLKCERNNHQDGSITNFDLSNAELKKWEVKYPQPHGTLNNIMAVVSKELKINKNSIIFTYKALSQKNTNFWSCQCNLNWPSPINISSIAKTKKEATRITSLKVLHWLTVQGNLKGGKPILLQSKDIKDLRKANVEININDTTALKLEKLLTVYDENISELLKVPSSLQFVSKDDKIDFLQYPESKKVRMALNRNKLLQRRVIEKKENESIQSLHEKMPIFSFKSAILKAVQDNNVVIIKGEPGCGKSTQVPQYLLDEAAAAGKACDVNIIVTQPRRISATSLAERVAEERDEMIGDTIGYQVRFKTIHPKPPGGGIKFCSSGILLRILQSNPQLNGVSHVILDEAHERDVNTDMLMLLLKRVLVTNPNLKLIIMSATINPELFQNYFDLAESIFIPGFSYPVQTHFLDDITSVSMHQTRKAQEIDHPRISHSEIADVIRWINKTKPDGAILCFLPGWQDIKSVSNYLQKYISPETCLILPLHSRLDFAEQNNVFKSPPPGVRKIILSTNVAETSITIDDVVYVVDSGVHKEERLSSDKSSSVLDDRWISQANSSQRKGRAGRVRPGEAFLLYSRERYNKFPIFPLPELHRVPLEKVVLDIKTYSANESVQEFLGALPEPPSSEATQRAIEELVELGALTSDETLTCLGHRIAKFSTNPRLSKALVHAAILGCLDPMLKITSILSADADMFANSLEERSDIAELKKERDSFSDHYAMLNIFEEWIKLYEARESDELFCTRNMLRRNTLRLIFRIRQLCLEQLRDAGMNYTEENLEHDPEMVKAILLSATNSFIFRRNWDVKNGRIRFNTHSFIAENGKKATLASDSVCYKQSNLPSPLMTYFRKQESAVRRTSVIREASTISPLALTIFLDHAQAENAESSDKVVIIDERHLPFKLMASKRDAELLSKLRLVINEIISYYLAYEGATKDDKYYKISAFREIMVECIGSLLMKSSHSIIVNENNVPS